MTRPRNDGRPRIERAREAAKLKGYAAHDRSGEVSDALTDAMLVVEAALLWDDGQASDDALRAAIAHIKNPVRR